MKTLYIERSTGECRDGNWVGSLDLKDVGRIVVGIGPGSFAGIRSALAFAQGYVIGTGCEVLGLPSPCALVESAEEQLAVIGDARRGKFWIALFDGFNLTREVFQVEQDQLKATIPEGFKVVTTDEKRIGGTLAELFAAQYIGGKLPTADGLQRFAEANPAILKPEPLPIYLNPAVRD